MMVDEVVETSDGRLIRNGCGWDDCCRCGLTKTCQYYGESWTDGSTTYGTYDNAMMGVL